VCDGTEGTLEIYEDYYTTSTSGDGYCASEKLEVSGSGDSGSCIALNSAGSGGKGKGKGSVVCPGFSFEDNTQCDCDGDCGLSWCGCEEAEACCSGERDTSCDGYCEDDDVCHDCSSIGCLNCGPSGKDGKGKGKNFCEDCAKDFSMNGGCEDFENEALIPEGCDDCGEEAAKFCGGGSNKGGEDDEGEEEDSYDPFEVCDSGLKKKACKKERFCTFNKEAKQCTGCGYKCTEEPKDCDGLFESARTCAQDCDFSVKQEYAEHLGCDACNIFSVKSKKNGKLCKKNGCKWKKKAGKCVAKIGNPVCEGFSSDDYCDCDGDCGGDLCQCEDALACCGI